MEEITQTPSTRLPSRPHSSSPQESLVSDVSCIFQMFKGFPRFAVCVFIVLCLCPSCKRVFFKCSEPSKLIATGSSWKMNQETLRQTAISIQQSGHHRLEIRKPWTNGRAPQPCSLECIFLCLLDEIGHKCLMNVGVSASDRALLFKYLWT